MAGSVGVALCSAAKANSVGTNSHLNAYLPFQISNDKRLVSGTRQVFAHWHFFPISIDNKAPLGDYYEINFLRPEGEKNKYINSGGLIRERPFPRNPRPETDWLVLDMIDDMRSASEIGIDAFQLNIPDVSEHSVYWRYLLAALDATVRAELPIKVMPCLDCTSGVLEDSIQILTKRLGTLVDHSGLMRTADGRIYLSAFFAERYRAGQWNVLLTALKKLGWRPFFFAIFLDSSNADPSIFSLADMVSIWSGDHFGSFTELWNLSTKFSSLKWCEPIWPQDFRPKAQWYTEASNSLLFRKGWEQAIRMGSEAVNILTWNDYSEGSEIRPSTSIKHSFYDLAAFYIDWYKLGRMPTIVRDVLYYFYRVEASSGPNYGMKQSSPFQVRYEYGPKNDIELVAFLTKPARLIIGTSAGLVVHDAPAGISSVRAPLVPGFPRFELRRNNEMVIQIHGAFEIRTSSEYQDLLYHGGSSARL